MSVAEKTTCPPVSIADRYASIRSFSDRIARPLTPEDCMIQSMEDASPIRWHLAHTTWFFETFILGHREGYQVFNEQFRFLFNSYYNAIGDQFPRPGRGTISRPGLQEIRDYRRHVDDAMAGILADRDLSDDLRYVMDVGLNHEQQHQELMLTDIKHAFAANPLLPVYEANPFAATAAPTANGQTGWQTFDPGMADVGHGSEAFAFDNESPRHQVFLPAHDLANHPVTNRQFLEFMEDGGYQRPDHWLSLGWDHVQREKWQAPLYWLERDGQWFQFTLAGLVPVDPDWPVCHVSYFEADAFARWAGCRLPTEFEWENASAVADRPDHGTGHQFADRLAEAGQTIHPTGESGNGLAGMDGGVWEWTSSSYSPYPGYSPPPGALGEYNGKFMCNQYVLRGGSVATSSDHIRPTYRNFFPPQARWQFSGLRLARSPGE